MAAAWATSLTPAEATSEVATSAAEIAAAEAISSRGVGQLLAARHLPLHHLADQPDDPFVASDADVAALVGGRPVLEVPLRRELVELGAAKRDVDACVSGRILLDRRAGQLHAPDRRIAPTRAQFEPHHELQLLERRHLGGEA